MPDQDVEELDDSDQEDQAKQMPAAALDLIKTLLSRACHG
jgi:hypothetical protein